MNKENIPIPPSTGVLEKFQSELTPELYRRLLLFASERCKNLTWRGILGGQPVAGKEPEDFVQDAVRSFLEGKRKWNPDKCSLKQFLEGAIRSTTGHSSEKKENTVTVRDSIGVGENGEDQSIIGQISNEEPSYEEKEDVSLREHRMWEFMGFLEDEPQILAVFEALYDGVTKRSEIAELLGITVKDVTNLRKRLGTKIEGFKEAQFKNETIKS